MRLSLHPFANCSCEFAINLGLERDLLKAVAEESAAQQMVKNAGSK